MKENNYFRLKIYILIFIISFTIGWLGYPETIAVENNIEIRRRIFDYGAFGIMLSIGFLLTLLYDVYVYHKKKKEK